jgi:hypothetical protein
MCPLLARKHRYPDNVTIQSARQFVNEKVLAFHFILDDGTMSQIPSVHWNAGMTTFANQRH